MGINVPQRALACCVLLLTLGSALAVQAQVEGEQANVLAVEIAPERVIKPQFVRPLFALNEQGHNDASPIWAEGGGLLAFERAEESRREIVIARSDGSVVKSVYFQNNQDDLGLGALLADLGKSVSYNSGIAWAKNADRFVFMSNGGEGNYDIFLGSLSADAVQRLTHDAQKDGQPSWSPTEDKVIFVSGRTGIAQLFLFDVGSQRTERLSKGEHSYLYPRWSPDGKRIAAIYGENENHDIVLIDNLPGAVPVVVASPAAVSSPVVATSTVTAPSEKRLTSWRYDELSPSWSPDGKYIAFYSNYNIQDDPKIWSLLVVEAEGNVATTNEQMAAKVVANNVIPDVSSGPAWFPDSRRIAYVLNDKQDYNPIHVVEVASRNSSRLETGTSINHDLAISSNGFIAFRAQVDQWDQIFLAKLPGVSE